MRVLAWALIVAMRCGGRYQWPGANAGRASLPTPTPPAPLFFREPWRQSAPTDASRTSGPRAA